MGEGATSIAAAWAWIFKGACRPFWKRALSTLRFNARDYGTIGYNTQQQWEYTQYNQASRYKLTSMTRLVFIMTLHPIIIIIRIRDRAILDRTALQADAQCLRILRVVFKTMRKDQKDKVWHWQTEQKSKRFAQNVAYFLGQSLFRSNLGRKGFIIANFYAMPIERLHNT